MKVGENNVEIKTTSIQHLAKKYARNVFKSYKIDQETGKFKFEEFMDWIKKHRHLYNNYYNGFHNEIWEIDQASGTPLYHSRSMEFKSQAKMILPAGKTAEIQLSLLRSMLIVTQKNSMGAPLMLISLEGLAVKPYFHEIRGSGI